MSINNKAINTLDKTSEVDSFDYITRYYSASAINSSGEREVVVSDEEDKLAGAKSVINEYTNNERYFVKAVGITLFNPTNRDHQNSRKYNWKFVKVKKETFDNYLKFLKTGTIAFLTLAERSM